MELSYIWVENINDGLIREQGFNFDNRFQYQMQYKTNNKFELKIKSNPNYIEDFFIPENHHPGATAIINNVTAIVGQNGAGKSSILEFLKDNFGRENRENVYIDEIYDKKYLYIFREYKCNRVEHYIYVSPGIHIEIIKDTMAEFFYEKRIDRVGLPRDINNTTLIYFSNVYDYRGESSSGKMLNISTNYLSSHQYRQDNLKIDIIDHEYKIDEVNRQIEFVYNMKNSLKEVYIPFKLPEKINFVFNVRNRAIVDIMEKDESKFMKSIWEVFEFITPRYTGSTNINSEKFRLPDVEQDRKTILDFTRIILVHIASEYLRDPNLISFMNRPLFRKEFQSDENNDFKRLIEEIKIFANEINGAGVFANMLNSLAMLMERFYNTYRNRAKTVGTSFVVIYFEIEELTSGMFKEFFQLYHDTSIKDEFVNPSWRKLSSGENALLNIYSRFYYASQRDEILMQPENDLIILIDEGELYLHPHWQGKLLNSLVEFLPVVFKNKLDIKQRNIQVILTSNSPFLVSDLPSINTMFLKKEKEQAVVIEDLEEHHQTFAANIHSLLAHSFFMEDGVTGSFAKRKINEIIHLLIKGDIDTILENEEKIEKTINLIGEPVIRTKLSQMLTDRRMVGVNKEIIKLNSRLKKLEKWKDDKN
ncbi:hypothetical protein CON74_25580 [Bacillus thuringiensis]|uniref:AAA family ATPase n=1 Tax=Bacillus thuringiensis TaxID=1428 RepID=UPI000BEC99D6|nr:AAA family ATPase [Bacillus thuringiensis]PEA58034.1 hypothetical protein CON74_25580 [Bacillus thuringiensis]HDR8143058.1 AAA family ATPase [Bacillus cereus]